EQVLSAVSDALGLDELERRHLVDLVRPTPPSRATAPITGPARARPAVRMMLDALDPVPAVLHGPRLDVIAMNRTCKILIDDFDAMPPAERNMVRWMFLDPRARAVYPDWAEVAAQLVAILRVSAGPDPHEERLTTLIGELTTRSPEFVEFWADHQVF